MPSLTEASAGAKTESDPNGESDEGNGTSVGNDSSVAMERSVGIEKSVGMLRPVGIARSPEVGKGIPSGISRLVGKGISDKKDGIGKPVGNDIPVGNENGRSLKSAELIFLRKALLIRLLQK